MMGLEQFLFFSLNPQAFLFLLFVLEPDFIKGTLCLSVAGTLNGKLGGNPLGFPFSVFRLLSSTVRRSSSRFSFADNLLS